MVFPTCRMSTRMTLLSGPGTKGTSALPALYKYLSSIEAMSATSTEFLLFKKNLLFHTVNTILTGCTCNPLNV